MSYFFITFKKDDGVESHYQCNKNGLLLGKPNKRQPKRSLKKELDQLSQSAVDPPQLNSLAVGDLNPKVDYQAVIDQPLEIEEEHDNQHVSCQKSTLENWFVESNQQELYMDFEHDFDYYLNDYEFSSI